jgi:cobalt-zinc-cadmium efflux system protein
MEHPAKPPRSDFRTAFKFSVILNLGFVAVEAVAGLLAGSLALLSDAGHNLGDVFGLLLAWGAHSLTKRSSTERRTYGWRKVSILAALINSIVLLMIAGGIGWEAVRRLAHPTPVGGRSIIGVAAVGIVVNGAAALLFLPGRKKDLNIRGAFLHLTSDAALSGLVVIAGVGIVATGWTWLDPAMGLLIVAVILVSTWSLLRDSFNLAVDAVPKHIDPAEVREYLGKLPGVASVHDLHIWAMSTSDVALTAHLIRNRDFDNRSQAGVQKEVQKRFGITHVTIQWERADEPCECRATCEPGP